MSQTRSVHWYKLVNLGMYYNLAHVTLLHIYSFQVKHLSCCRNKHLRLHLHFLSMQVTQKKPYGGGKHIFQYSLTANPPKHQCLPNLHGAHLVGTAHRGVGHGGAIGTKGASRRWAQSRASHITPSTCIIILTLTQVNCLVLFTLQWQAAAPQLLLLVSWILVIVKPCVCVCVCALSIQTGQALDQTLQLHCSYLTLLMKNKK